MLKKNPHHYKYHCERDCETFENELLSTESAGAANNNALGIIINNDNNNNNDNISFFLSLHLFAVENFLAYVQ